MQQNKKTTNFDPHCHIGETHGVYTIIGMLDEKDKYGHYVYKCICNKCGFIKYSHYGAISGNKGKSTQCKHLKANGQYKTYGYTWENKRIGEIFRDILKRCYSINDSAYRWYGARGIKVCNEWINNPKLFEEWALNNGYKDNLTIDRVESNKDYCSENCRWISLEENTRRAGKVNWIEVDGRTLTGRQWATELGLGLPTINKYIKQYGLDKTKELIRAILKEPLLIKYRKSHQTWFSVYGIQL